MAPRDSTVVIHRALRAAILTNELAAGAELSQARVARDFGVSRGPVREAFRLLERDGLLHAAVNQRARVAPFSIEDLEQLYAVRIVTESLAVALSVPCFTPAELDRLDEALARMDGLAGGDAAEWEVVHAGFHRLLAGHAGERLQRLSEQYGELAERYRRVYVTTQPRAWGAGAGEHRDIIDACRARDAPTAAARLARHLSRTALSVLMAVAPDHDPRVVRGAVRQVTGPVTATSAAAPVDRASA